MHNPLKNTHYVLQYNIQSNNIQLDISNTLCSIIKAASFIMNVVFFNEHVLRYINNSYIHIAQSVRYI